MKSFDYLRGKNVPFKEIHLSEVPKSSQDVERLYGCPLHQVLKTLVFVSENKPVVVVVPGDRRASLSKLRSLTGVNSLRIAKPDEVLSISGYTVGGVTPFGIESDVIMAIDSSVFEMDMVNIGSGKAEIGIELSSQKLKDIWDGIIGDICE